MTGRKATSYEVARASGVSQATVSYVLNNTPGQKISEETRQRVVEAAALLDYHPFGPARTLKRGRSSTVVLVLPEGPGGHSLDRFIGHVAAALSLHDLTLLLTRLPAGRSVLSVIDEISPAAVISSFPLSVEDGATLARRGVPVEVTAIARDDPSALSLSQEERVGELQSDLLLRLGHRRLAYALPADGRLERYWSLRLAGVKHAVSEHADASLEVSELGDDRDEVRQAVRAWTRSGVTAVCAYNDEIALAVLGAAAAEGLGVPGDLAVVGVDDIPLAKHAVPPLTTVRLDISGRATFVVSRIMGQEPAHGPQDPSLVIREST